MPRLEIEGLGGRTRIAEAAQRLVALGVAEVAHHEAAVLVDDEPDPEEIHDMRVATRRLRAALQLTGSEHLQALASDVKRLQDGLGTVRDLQVQRAWLLEHRRRGALTGVLRGIERALPPRCEAVRQTVVEWRESTVPALIGASRGVHGPGRLGGHRLRERLADRLATLDRRIRDVLDAADAATAHRLRLAVKKLRYDAELLAPALGRPAGRLVRALAPLQVSLGDLHDADVRLAWLQELAALAPRGDLVAIHELREATEEERERLARVLVDVLSRWRKRRRSRRFRRRILH